MAEELDVPGTAHEDRTAPGGVEALHRRFRQSRSAADLAALMAHYERLVGSLATRSATRREDRDDLVQVAYVGLLTALERYDPERGVQFVTYAWATVSGHLKRHHRDWDWSVRVPRQAQEDSRAARAAAERLVHELGRTPTAAEVAAAAGLSPARAVEAARARAGFRAASLDLLAPDAAAAGPGPAADDDMAQAEERTFLHSLLTRLGDQERQILRLRFVEELSQDEIAARLGSTQVRVSRQLARTLGKLRVWARAEVSWRPGPARHSERRSGS